MMISKRESGNVLFLILIAVALFAALSYIVTTSSRSGAGTISPEKAKLQAAEVLNHFQTFNQGVQRLLTTAGCSPEQINAYTPAYVRINGIELNLANPNSPPDGHCNIFGGKYGLPEYIANADMFVDESTQKPTTPKSGHYSFRVTKIINVGSDLNEIAVVASNMKRDVCLYFMSILDINTPDIPIDKRGSTVAQIGDLNVAVTGTDALGDEDPILAGKLTLVSTTAALGQSQCSLVSVLVTR
jgi:hypothetical protein